MDTTHRKRVSVPIFSSSEHSTNLTSDGSNSIFEQHLEPSIAVPLAAKHPTMHLDQASVDYSITNVRAGVNDSVKLHLRHGALLSVLSHSSKNGPQNWGLGGVDRDTERRVLYGSDVIPDVHPPRMLPQRFVHILRRLSHLQVAPSHNSVTG